MYHVNALYAHRRQAYLRDLAALDLIAIAGDDTDQLLVKVVNNSDETDEVTFNIRSSRLRVSRCTALRPTEVVPREAAVP